MAVVTWATFSPNTEDQDHEFGVATHVHLWYKTHTRYRLEFCDFCWRWGWGWWA